MLDRVTGEELLLKEVSAVGRLVRLDGESLGTLDDVFRAYVKVFDFPEYFGWNWPAFTECMTTIPEYSSAPCLTVIERSHRLLRHEPSKLPVLLEVLDEIGSRWAGALGVGLDLKKNGIPFHTILTPLLLSHPAPLERIHGRRVDEESA